jgi:hypothetical protein
LDAGNRVIASTSAASMSSALVSITTSPGGATMMTISPRGGASA